MLLQQKEEHSKLQLSQMHYYLILDITTPKKL